jgi:hypothetical protein
MPVIVSGQTEVQADALGVPYMEITIGFRGKAGSDLCIAARGQILVNKGPYKIMGSFFRLVRHVKKTL